MEKDKVADHFSSFFFSAISVMTVVHAELLKINHGHRGHGQIRKCKG